MWIQRLSLICDGCGAQIDLLLASEEIRLKDLAAGLGYRSPKEPYHFCPSCSADHAWTVQAKSSGRLKELQWLRRQFMKRVVVEGLGGQMFSSAGLPSRPTIFQKRNGDRLKPTESTQAPYIRSVS